MKHGIVGRTPGGLFPYQAWPTVARDDSGTLYAAASGHRLGHVCPFGKTYLYVSRDEGDSWTGPIVASDTCMDDRDAGVCAWGDGNVLLTWFDLPISHYDERAADGTVQNAKMLTPLAQAGLEVWKSLPEDLTRPGGYLRLSRDGGKSWSDVVKVPLTAPHGPTRTPDGRLLFVGKECWWGQGLETKAIYAMESRDDGMTWTLLSQLPCPKGFAWNQIHEAHGLQLADGTVLAALRVHDDSLPGRITVYTLRSTDGGRTWSDPQGLPGLLGTPPHLMQHSSGAVILTYSRRIEPRGQLARISWDGGLTWSEDVPAGREAFDWDHGYPSTVELSDGSLLTVYYQKYESDDYNSILSTRWTLPEK